MIPASFSTIRGITARGNWPGSDSRHDDACPLVTLRGYPAGDSRNQREPGREVRPPDQRHLTGFHFHDLRHTGNALDGVARWPRQSYGNAQGHRARSGHGKGKRAS
jgi:hypothetical protein